MKKSLSVGFVVFALFSAQAKFVYDADDQKVVDAENGWEFKAILKNSDELSLDGTGCSYSGSSPCSLDLTEITDADGKIVDCVIDCADSSMSIEGGKAAKGTEYKTKNELLDSYGIQRYWDENNLEEGYRRGQGLKVFA